MGGIGSRPGCKPSGLQLTLRVHVPNNWVLGVLVIVIIVQVWTLRVSSNDSRLTAGTHAAVGGLGIQAILRSKLANFYGPTKRHFSSRILLVISLPFLL